MRNGWKFRFDRVFDLEKCDVQVHNLEGMSVLYWLKVHTHRQPQNRGTPESTTGHSRAEHTAQHHSESNPGAVSRKHRAVGASCRKDP